MVPLSSWWLNAGVSPVYYEYILALQLHSEAGGAVLPTSVDVRQWLPGDAVFGATLYVPDTLKSRKYRLRVGVLDPRTRQPAIELAIEGRPRQNSDRVDPFHEGSLAVKLVERARFVGKQ